MSRFIEITCYEFKMSIRRPGYWIAYVLLGLFYVVSIFLPTKNSLTEIIPSDRLWSEAGHLVFMYNIFLPLLAGIITADRMQRDFRNGIRELQCSTPLSIPAYILAKYFGALAAALLPFFLLTLVSGSIMVAQGLAPLEFFWPLLMAFLSIAAPAHAFVIAFSLACPLIMPVRVYQVLFTGYWFWGNMLSPKAFPTISDTPLNAVGQYPLQAYFDVLVDSTQPVSTAYTPTDAVINLLVLTACITAALIAVNLFLRRQGKLA